MLYTISGPSSEGVQFARNPSCGFSLYDWSDLPESSRA